MTRSRFIRQGRPLIATCAAIAFALAVGCTDQGSGKPRALARAGSALTTATACAGQQTCIPADAHAKHQAAGFDCIFCHPCGGQFGFRAGYTFAGGTAIQPTDSYTPATSTSPASCTVACHYPLGSPAAPVQWNAPAPLACVGCHDVPTLLKNFPNHPVVSPTSTRADCQVCHIIGDQHTSGTVVLQGHPTTWMTVTDPGFHAFSAVRGLAACQACHLADLSGGKTNTACSSCHKAALAGGTASDFATCSACHGGTNDQAGAPPVAIWGYAGDPNRGGGTADPVRVGAHTAHVTAGAYGPAFGCEVCHVKPADFLAPSHIDNIASSATPLALLTFGGLAVTQLPQGVSPTWDRGTASCSTTYCHGATLPGALHPNPVWTGGPGEVYCGSCHGAPPPSPHLAVDTSTGYGVCNPCHALTVDGAGNIIPASQGGRHLDGLLEASGHDATWMDTTSTNFHAFAADRGIQNCAACHGADLGGGSVGVACAACHKAGGQANDFSTCTACHGGTDNQSGAPPAAIWGYAGDPSRGGGTLDPIRIGAHTKHVQTTQLALPFDCGLCHVKPTSILSAGHIDDPTPVATLTFAGIAASGPAPAPSWTRATATCASTYCHGNYAGVFAYDSYDWGSDTYFTKYVNYIGLKAAPAWTDGPMTCGSCHGNPPPGTGVWHSGLHGYPTDGYNDCQLCHPDAYSVNGVGQSITNPSQHLNGIVEVTPKWQSKCFGCH